MKNWSPVPRHCWLRKIFTGFSGFVTTVVLQLKKPVTGACTACASIVWIWGQMSSNPTSTDVPFHVSLLFGHKSFKTDKWQKAAEGQRWPHIFRSYYGLCGTELWFLLEGLGTFNMAETQLCALICGLSTFKSWPGAPMGAEQNPSFHNQSD